MTFARQLAFVPVIDVMSTYVYVHAHYTQVKHSIEDRSHTCKSPSRIIRLRGGVQRIQDPGYGRLLVFALLCVMQLQGGAIQYLPIYRFYKLHVKRWGLDMWVMEIWDMWETGVWDESAF